ncbi:MAG: hypothetical protein RIS35_721 [Pseudomonadota bacterium]|jgi:folate-binding protein YgfZ
MSAQPLPFDPASPESLAEFLGARAIVDECGPQACYENAEAGAGPGESRPWGRAADSDWTAGSVSPLLDLGMLAVDGAEAAGFLHNQLTNDVQHLGDAQARWYGYCSPKGRLLSNFLGWRTAEGFAFTVARGLAEPMRKRLSMYVLRSKAKVRDASAEAILLGLIGERAPAALERLGLTAPEAMAVTRQGALTVIGLAPVAAPGETAAPVSRWMLCVPVDRLAEVWTELRALLEPVSTAVWRRTEILSGVPRIVPPTSEHFVPQMVNFELVGGVDFKKGCYPGQEVVARSQYLGKLKRRTFLAHLDGAPPAAGTDVTLPGQTEPVGEVVIAAPGAGGGAVLLFEARTDTLAGGTPTVEGRALRLGRLPYEIPGG